MAYDLLDLAVTLATSSTPPSPVGIYNALRARAVDLGVPGVPTHQLRIHETLRDAQMRHTLKKIYETRPGQRIRAEAGSVRES